MTNDTGVQTGVVTVDVAGSRRSWWNAGDAVRSGGIFGALLLIVVAASLVSPSFLTESNWLNILRTITLVGILAVGQTFVAISGGMADVSAGSVLGLSAVLCLGLQPSLGTAGAVTVALAAGVLVGIVNGTLAGVLRANSIVSTIGSGVVASGIALMYTGGRTQFGQDQAFSAFGTGSTLGIPNIVLSFAAVVVLGQLVLSTTSFGRRLYATGGGYEAARASAIGVRGMVTGAFVISGLTAAIAGIVTAALLGQVNYDSGSTFTFTSIAAVAVGGTSLAGGYGSVLRTVVGVVIIGVLNNIVVLAGWPLNLQTIVTGAVIVLAVALDTWLRRRGS